MPIRSYGFDDLTINDVHENKPLRNRQ